MAQYGPAGEFDAGHLWRHNRVPQLKHPGQLSGISYNGTLRHEYRCSATANNGRLTSYKNWQSGEDVQYQYDSLARLTSAQTIGPEWGQSFGYDGFGNLISKAVTKGTATVLSVTADPATNRISGLSYDANGNVTNLSGVGTMSYDGRNRFVGNTIGGQLPTRGYDPSNRKIWSFTAAGDFKFDFYSPIGQKLGTYRVYWVWPNTGPAAISRVTEYKYFGGRVIRVNGATEVYPMEDRLGSTVPHLPYGDERNPTAQDRVKFATYHRESSGVLDYAMNRYYSPVHGRFTSPDPYRASGGPANPGSWNRYTYVGGDPVNHVDPRGLYAEAICSDDPWAPAGSLLNGPCHGDGYPTATRDQTQAWCVADILGFGSGGPTCYAPDLGALYGAKRSPNVPDPFCGINPVSGFAGFSPIPKGETGHIRPGVGGLGSFGASRAGGRTHMGLDISGVSGESTIWASLPGTVTSVGSIRGYGLTVVVDVGHGYTQLYAHLNSVESDIVVGAAVVLGQILGVMGQTGNAAGQPASEAHLHFEVRNSNIAVNPANFMNSPCPWWVP